MVCRCCGQEIPDDSITCPKCGYVIPGNRNIFALVGITLSSIAFLCFLGILNTAISWVCLFLAVFGISFGLLGLRFAIKKNFSKKLAIFALICGVINVILSILFIVIGPDILAAFVRIANGGLY